jgi:hypothetical protein
MLYQRRPFSNILRALNDGFHERAMSLYIDMIHGGYHFNEYTNTITDECKVRINCSKKCFVHILFFLLEIY